jgi:hypothetical protein
VPLRCDYAEFLLHDLNRNFACCCCCCFARYLKKLEVSTVRFFSLAISGRLPRTHVKMPPPDLVVSAPEHSLDGPSWASDLRSGPQSMGKQAGQRFLVLCHSIERPLPRPPPPFFSCFTQRRHTSGRTALSHWLAPEATQCVLDLAGDLRRPPASLYSIWSWG